MGIAVRFLSNLASGWYFKNFVTRFSFISLFPGDLLCIVNSISGNETQLDIATIAGPFHGSLSAYAAQEPPCFNKVFSSPSIPVVGFIKYGPVFLMIQVMTLIIILIIMTTYLGNDPRHCWAHLNFLPENATEDWKILSLSCWGKKSLIILFIIYLVICLYLLKCQEALLGKDPDFAEDFNNGQFSTDKILRERQRQEICGALNGSSTYFYLFMLKNILEIFLGILFIIANVLIALNSEVDLLEIIGCFQICKLML